MSVSYPTKLLLAYRSGDRCALPDCGQQLIPLQARAGSPSNVGEAAHIAGERPGGSRGHRSARYYNPDMTDDQRNGYNNLIYVWRELSRKN